MGSKVLHLPKLDAVRQDVAHMFRPPVCAFLTFLSLRAFYFLEAACRANLSITNKIPTFQYIEVRYKPRARITFFIALARESAA